MIQSHPFPGFFFRTLPLASIIALWGCASIGDMADKQNIFGGTSYIVDQVDQPCILGPCTSCGPCWLIDLPLSLAVDLALLPVTVTLGIVRAARKEPEPKEK